jgi:hypothetical protein
MRGGIVETVCKETCEGFLLRRIQTMEGRIRLNRSFFSETERELFSFGDLSAILFTYPTGVHGVRLKNRTGALEILPFKGQQIWDATFNGRKLTMRSMFLNPKNVDFFLHTYGCFMMHCGALRMGVPGPEDDHPLHGELPYADYLEAELLFGQSERGPWVAVSGMYEHDVAFSAHYQARPRVTLYGDSNLFDISMEIRNRSSYSMDLMYMCHVNFRPVDNGRIIQSAGWDPGYMQLRTSIPGHVKVTPEFEAFQERLRASPELTRVIRPEDEYHPEVAFFIQHPLKDSAGLSHFMQVHPDETADYICYRPDELERATRWIVRTADQDALGLALPATCDAEGYTAEKKKGHLKQLEGNSSVKFNITAGMLGPKEASLMKEHITSIMEGEET